MGDRDHSDLRGRLAALSTDQLLQAVVQHRQQEALIPEAYAAIESILRERGVAMESAVAAFLRDFPDPGGAVQLVVVATAFNPIEAQLIRMRLEQAGFLVHMADENLPGLHYGWGIAAGGVKVLVNAADADAARTLLAELPIPIVLQCPACASQNVIHETRLQRGITIAAGLLLGSPVPQIRHAARCSDCGHAWEE
jgi:Putative prokaryotic signal transducing protein